MKHSIKNTRNFFRSSIMAFAIVAMTAALHPVKSYASGTDTIPPNLYVAGPDTTYLEVEAVHKQSILKLCPKVDSAIDINDGDVTANVLIDTTQVNTTVVGLYRVNYSVSNKKGNTAWVFRYIDVIDTIHPVLQLIGDATVELPLNYSYTDSGAIATSWRFTSAQLQHRIMHTTNLDNTKAGNYTCTYTLTDSFGNSAIPVTRYITVFVNKTPPVISLLSSGTEQVCQNSVYHDPGYTLNDPYYRFSDIPIDTLGSFTSTTNPGLYYLRYKATDPDGNIGYSGYRYINVMASNDEACLTNASTNRIDSTICNGACPLLAAPVSGSRYKWSTGDTTLSTQICTNSDTVVEVSITNGSSSISYLYNLSITPSYYSCMWPGDANADGVADNNDVLAIGIAYGDSGSLRRTPYTSTNWAGHPSYDWEKTFTSGVDYKNADCDGNGYIDSSDLAAIYQNYGDSHHKSGGASGSPTDPPLSVTFPTDSAQAGDTVTATINLGTMSNPVSNAYGIAFSLNYSSLYIKPGQAKANLSGSWFGKQGQNLIYFIRDDSANQTIDIAVTRTDHQDISGYGKLATVNIIMQDNLGGKALVNRKVSLTPSDVNLITYNQSPIPLYATGDSVVVTGPLASVSNHLSNLFKDVKLYPNPASETLNVDPGNQSLTSIRLVNELGMVLFEQTDPARGIVQIPVSQLKSGVYTVILNSKNGTITRQVLKH